jgi:hypothetical protein
MVTLGAVPVVSIVVAEVTEVVALAAVVETATIRKSSTNAAPCCQAVYMLYLPATQR